METILGVDMKTFHDEVNLEVRLYVALAPSTLHPCSMVKVAESYVADWKLG